MRREFDLPITAITGPATDNEVGQVYITAGLGLPAHNARRDAAGLRGGGAATRWPAWSRRAGGWPRPREVQVARPSLARARRDEGRGRRRRRLRRRRAAPAPAPASRGHRVRGHQPEPGGEAGRRGASRARAAHRRALLGRDRPARRRAGGTSCSSVSSTASRRGWRARCSTPAPASSSTWRPTSGCATPALRALLRRRTPRPSWCTASATAWPTSLGAPAARGHARSPRPGCFATAAQLALYPLAARRARRRRRRSSP